MPETDRPTHPAGRAAVLVGLVTALLIVLALLSTLAR
jgi:hypothetical protein